MVLGETQGGFQVANIILIFYLCSVHMGVFVITYQSVHVWLTYL